MNLQARLNAIETAARRRRWRHPDAMMPAPLKFDTDDPLYRDVNRRVAELVGDRVPPARPGCGRIEMMHREIDVARIIMDEDPELARDVRDLIEKGFADAAPVSDTGDVEHEE